MKFSFGIKKIRRPFLGFTLVEMLIVIAILSIIFKISLSVFYDITKQESLDKDVETAYSYLLKARNQTINGEADSVYGVHFASTSVSMFRGDTYVASTTVSDFDFANKSYASEILLSGGTTDIVFKKITGSPSATGTIIYRITSDSAIHKTLTIHGTGLVEVQ
jgi:prepilin-type N-terminal cleavage/methylation domain-containing protein